MRKRFAITSPLSPITAWAKHLRNVPVWIIHGAKDSDAPIKDSEELIRAIEQSGDVQSLRCYLIAIISFSISTTRMTCSIGCPNTIVNSPRDRRE
jgi:hypothetical protein